MSETRVPAIPSVTSANITDVAKAIKQLLDVREGVVGDPLDANVTFRDLINAGAVTLRPGWNGSGRRPVIPPWVEPDGYDPTTDLTIPPRPEGFTVTGLFATVQLQWNTPGYRNHAYAEVWRSNTNVLGNAVRIGTSDTRFYVDSLGGSSSAYYWVRFVSVANVTGPYNASEGILGQTAQDPGLLLDSLTGQITENELYSSLGARIDLIDGPATLAGSVAARLAAEATERATAIAAEALARTTAINLEAATRATAIQQEADQRTSAIDSATSSLQTQIDLLSAASTGDIGEVLSVIKSEEQSRTSGDQAIASQSNLLLTLSNGNAAAIQTEAATRSSADGAQASTLSLLYVNSGDAKAAVLNEQNARVAGDTSTASQLSALKASSDNNTAGIAVERSVSAASDSVLASQVTALTANYGAASSAILNEQEVRANADAASASVSSSLASSIAASSSAIQVEQSTRSTADTSLASQVTTIASETARASAGLQVEQLARASDTSALSSQITNVSAISGTTSSALRIEQQTSVDRDSALSSQITGFTSALGGTLATLQVEQQARADADSAVSSQIVRALARTDDATAALVVEQTARSNADSAFSGQVGSFSAIFGSNAAALVSEQSARATADSASASQLLNLNSSIGTSASALSSEAISRSAQDGALSSQVLNLSAATNGNSAAIRSEIQARTDQYTSVSSVVTTLQSSSAGNTAAIQQEVTTRSTETGSLFAKYGVKVDVAGHVSGFGLLSTANNATPTSAFGVRADQFFIAPPSVASATAPTQNLYNGYVWLDTSVTPNVTKYYLSGNWVTTSPRLPFIVQTTPTTINGVSVPAGVYIDTAFIRDGTITNAKIGSAAIDDAKIANLSATKITAGYLDADRIQAGTIDAAKIVAGSITATQIAAGAITASKIDANAITSEKISAGSINADKIASNAITSEKILAGSVTATKIDSRGLDIKDSAGNIVLSAGDAAAIKYGNGANLVVDDGFYDPTRYVSNNLFIAAWPTGFSPSDGGNQQPVKRFLRIGSTAGTFDLSSISWTITQGKRYRVRLSMFMSSDFDGFIMPAVHIPNVAWAVPGPVVSDPQGAFPNGHTGLSWGRGGWLTREAVYTASDFAAKQAQLRIAGRIASGYCEIYIEMFLIEDVITSGNISTYIADAAITNAKIGNAQVDTLTIAGNAVTVPKVVSRYDISWGVDSGQVYLSTSIEMNQSGLVFAALSVSQGFPYGFQSWNAWLYINGVPVFAAGGTRPGDSISLSGAAYVTVPANQVVTVPVQFVHYGPSSMGISQATLFVMGAKR